LKKTVNARFDLGGGGKMCCYNTVERFFVVKLMARAYGMVGKYSVTCSMFQVICMGTTLVWEGVVIKAIFWCDGVEM
jgi:hypothetical protein